MGSNILNDEGGVATTDIDSGITFSDRLIIPTLLGIGAGVTGVLYTERGGE